MNIVVNSNCSLELYVEQVNKVSLKKKTTLALPTREEKRKPTTLATYPKTSGLAFVFYFDGCEFRMVSDFFFLKTQNFKKKNLLCVPVLWTITTICLSFIFLDSDVLSCSD